MLPLAKEKAYQGLFFQKVGSRVRTESLSGLAGSGQACGALAGLAKLRTIGGSHPSHTAYYHAQYYTPPPRAARVKQS